MIAALLGPWPLHPRADRLAELRGTVEQLATEGAAIDLRLARLIGWIRANDVARLGYSSFTAFCKERVPWRTSQLRDLLRLVGSPLELVKEAASSGLIPLSIALLAPGRVEVVDQLEWLSRARAGLVSRRCPTGIDRGGEDDGFRVFVFGQDVADIQQARRRARLYLGAHLPSREVDRYILACWRQGRSAEQIRADARVPRPRLEFSPSWCETPDPATSLLGPWTEPRDPWHALELLDALVAVRDGRVAALGQLAETVVRQGLHFDMGFDTLDAFATQVVGVSQRSLERYRKLGQTFDMHPEIRAAVAEGLDLDRACFVGGIAQSGREARDWIGVCRCLGARMLAEVGDHVIERGSRRVLAECRRRLSAAPALAKTAEPAEHGGPPSSAVPEATETGGATSATETGGLSGGGGEATETGGAPSATETGGRVTRIAFGDLGRVAARGRKTPHYLPVDPDLVEAARWFLDTVPEPRGKGVSGQVKERDRYTCQNPECGRRSSTVEAHHVWWRSKGSDDDPERQITLCRCCHLRLIHASGAPVTVKQIGDAMVWSWPDRVVVGGP